MAWQSSRDIGATNISFSKSTLLLIDFANSFQLNLTPLIFFKIPIEFCMVSILVFNLSSDEV